MPSKHTDPMQAFAGPASDMFKFWISFWPVAPMFGVKWRFGGAFPGMEATAKPAAPRPAAPKPKPAPKAADTAAAAADTAVKEAIRDAETALESLAAEPAKSKRKPAPKPAAKSAAKPVPVAEPTPVPEPAPRASEPEEKVVAFEAPESPGEPGAARPANLLDGPPSKPDDLKLIKGIGPGLESKLNALGVYRFDQMSAFSDDDLRWIDDNLTAFKGRCFRDDWVAQARALLG